MFEFLTDHLRNDRPEEPQTYLEHGKFAVYHSSWLIWAGLVGLIHAVFPWWYKFYTAEQVIRIYWRLVNGDRHVELIDRYARKHGLNDYLQKSGRN